MSYRRMNVVRSFQVGLWSCAVPLVFAGAAGLVAHEAHAQSEPCEPGMLFCDDFSSGVIDPDRYEVYGGATMWIDNGVLMVHMPDSKSGFEVNLEEFGVEPESLMMDYELVDHLPVYSALRVSVQGQNPTEGTGEFTVAGMSVWRPFWNRCIFVVWNGSENLGCIAIGGASFNDPDPVSCDELLGGDPDTLWRRMHFVLLGPADGSDPDRPEGKQQIHFQIEGDFGVAPTCCKPHDGVGCNDPECEKIVCAQDPFCCDTMWDQLCANQANELCEVCIPTFPITRFDGKRTEDGYFCGADKGAFTFEQGVTDIRRLRVEYLSELEQRGDAIPNGCFPDGADDGGNGDDNGGENSGGNGGGNGGGSVGGAAGGPGVTLAIHRVAVQNTSDPGLASAVDFEPFAFVPGDPGDVVTVSITTNDFLLGPDSTLDMGADVLVHDITVTGPNTAEAVIEINPRARNGGRIARLGTDADWRYVEFMISPVCPIELPENEPPTVEIDAPNLVKPGEEFTVNTLWDDPDDLFIRAVLVVFEESTDKEFFSTDFFHLFPTHPDPVEMTFTVPGLPAGYYQIYAVADDGIVWDVQYSPLYVTDTAPPCPADLTGDGNVDVFDLLQLLTCWGSTVAGCEQADLTESGNVGVFDLLELLADWGPCPQ